MENHDYNYGKLITKLRTSSPLLIEPARLTDSIMNSIEANKIKSTKGKLIFWLRPILSAAAVLMLGLFLYQANENFGVPHSGSSSRLLNLTLQQKDFCEGISKLEPQNKKHFISQYLCYVQRNSTENKALNQILSKMNPKNNQ
jgi:hypothetical protein